MSDSRLAAGRTAKEAHDTPSFKDTSLESSANHHRSLGKPTYMAMPSWKKSLGKVVC